MARWINRKKGGLLIGPGRERASSICDYLPDSLCDDKAYDDFMDEDARSFIIRFAVVFLVFALALAGFMEWLDSIFGPEAEQLARGH